MHDHVNKALGFMLTRPKVPSPASAGITASEEEFRTRIGRADVCVRFGRIESCETSEPGSVVALPANDWFDDECLGDPASALGAYVQGVFPDRKEALRRLIDEKLAGESHEIVQSSPKRVDRSYGVAKCVYLANPLGSQCRIILASVTTKRADAGVCCEAPYLFAAMKSICREMNDQKLSALQMPVMGSGHGGLEGVAALLHLLLSVKAVLEDRSAGAHLRSVRIVIFRKDAATEPAIPRDVVGRILSVVKGTP